MLHKTAKDVFFDWLSEFVNGPLSPYSGRPPRLVYHYTSAAGLLGLLHSNRIWASDAACMNDPGEIRYAASILTKSFDQAVGANSAPELQELVQFSRGSVTDLANRVPVYLACFSEAPDLLSQWRAYGDDGRGFAVGIELKHVAPSAWNQAGGPAFRRRVIYGSSQQSKLASEMAEAAVGYVLATHGQPDPIIIGKIREGIVELSVCFKHPAYRAEREWRAIYTGYSTQPLPVSVRDRDGGLIPYVELEMPDASPRYSGKLAIKEIVIGPRNDMDATRRLLADTLSTIWSSQLARAIRVRNSEVPYRGG